MLELLLKLIDRLIDLEKHRQEMNRGTIADFVAPAMADLELVHKDYLGSFRRYREMLEDAAIPLTSDHPILAAIRKDNVFSQGLRSRIWVLAGLRDDPVLGGFMSRMVAYLSGAASPETFIEPPLQVSRNRYKTTLEAILKRGQAEPDKRSQAVAALDDTIQSLQTRYSDVVGEYFELKKKLLKPQ